MIFQDAHADFYASPTIAYSDDSSSVIQFINVSSGGQTYSWDFSDQNRFHPRIAVAHMYMNPGVYSVTLFVKPTHRVARIPLPALTTSLLTRCLKYLSQMPLHRRGTNRILHVYAEGLRVYGLEACSTGPVKRCMESKST